MTITGHYEGGLRCYLQHTRSNVIIRTDAPIDNNGKGESFSPTDLVAAALASCMITIMGIEAEKNQINIAYPSYEILKSMDNNPRKIKTITISIQLPAALSEKDRKILEEKAKNCPVALSLHSSIRQKVTFIYK